MYAHIIISKNHVLFPQSCYLDELEAVFLEENKVFPEYFVSSQQKQST